MATELLFWLGMVILAVYFAIRVGREIRRRTFGDDHLAESFERHMKLEHGGYRGDEDFSYLHDRLHSDSKRPFAA